MEVANNKKLPFISPALTRLEHLMVHLASSLIKTRLQHLPHQRPTTRWKKSFTDFNVLLIRNKEGFLSEKLKDVLLYSKARNKQKKNNGMIYKSVLQIIMSKYQSKCDNNLTYKHSPEERPKEETTIDRRMWIIRTNQRLFVDERGFLNNNGCGQAYLSPLPSLPRAASSLFSRPYSYSF